MRDVLSELRPVAKCVVVRNGLDKAVFALLQTDTHPSSNLSQTVLRVVKFNAVTGAVESTRDVNVDDAWSSWVESGASNFRSHANALMIAGRYWPRALHDLDPNFISRSSVDPSRFTMRLASSLRPLKGKLP